MTKRLDSQSPADKADVPTPRTDDQVAMTKRKISLIGCGPDGGMGEVEAVTADFARRLERELAAMTALNREHVRQLNEGTPRSAGTASMPACENCGKPTVPYCWDCERSPEWPRVTQSATSKC